MAEPAPKRARIAKPTRMDSTSLPDMSMHGTHRGEPIKLEVRHSMVVDEAGQPRHAQNIQLISKPDMTPEAFIAADGPYRGYTVLVIVPAKRVSFLDLPNEIRNQIYELLFQEAETIELQACKDERGVARSRLDPKKTRDRSNHNIGPATSHRVGNVTLALNVLRASKAVHGEAASVLYGTNAFRFSGYLPVNSFLRMIGDNIKHLEYIILPDAQLLRSRTGRTVQLLQGAIQLRRLDISWTDVCPFLTTEDKSYVRVWLYRRADDREEAIKHWAVLYGYASRLHRDLSLPKPAGAPAIELRTIPLRRVLCRDCAVDGRHRRGVETSDDCLSGDAYCRGYLRGCVRFDRLQKQSVREAFAQHQAVTGGFDLSGTAT